MWRADYDASRLDDRGWARFDYLHLIEKPLAMAAFAKANPFANDEAKRAHIRDRFAHLDIVASALDNAGNGTEAEREAALSQALKVWFPTEDQRPLMAYAYEKNLTKSYMDARQKMLKVELDKCLAARGGGDRSQKRCRAELVMREAAGGSIKPPG